MSDDLISWEQEEELRWLAEIEKTKIIPPQGMSAPEASQYIEEEADKRARGILIAQNKMRKQKAEEKERELKKQQEAERASALDFFVRQHRVRQIYNETGLLEYAGKPEPEINDNDILEYQEFLLNQNNIQEYGEGFLMPDDEIRCPRCGSAQITAKNKGFGLGKAAVGGLLLGPVGLLGGMIGSKKIKVVCLKCGKEWSPGE